MICAQLNGVEVTELTDPGCVWSWGLIVRGPATAVVVTGRAAVRLGPTDDTVDAGARLLTAQPS
jgi:hypothetical protein